MRLHVISALQNVREVDLSTALLVILLLTFTLIIQIISHEKVHILLYELLFICVMPSELWEDSIYAHSVSSSGNIHAEQFMKERAKTRWQPQMNASTMQETLHPMNASPVHENNPPEAPVTGTEISLKLCNAQERLQSATSDLTIVTTKDHVVFVTVEHLSAK